MHLKRCANIACQIKAILWSLISTHSSSVLNFVLFTWPPPMMFFENPTINCTSSDSEITSIASRDLNGYYAIPVYLIIATGIIPFVRMLYFEYKRSCLLLSVSHTLVKPQITYSKKCFGTEGYMHDSLLWWSKQQLWMKKHNYIHTKKFIACYYQNRAWNSGYVHLTLTLHVCILCSEVVIFRPNWMFSLMYFSVICIYFKGLGKINSSSIGLLNIRGFNM